MRIADEQRSMSPPVRVCAAALILVAGIGFVMSCAVPLLGPAPIHYESVSVVVGDRGALHSVAGLYSAIGNATDREITELELGFSLFGSHGEPVPGFGTNSFVAGVAQRIPAGESVWLCTSLDRHVPAGVTALSVSRFRVTSATFADGTTWQNPGSYVSTGAEQ
jgi:hypothetical protein